MISAEHLHTLASETELNLRSSVLDESAVPALVDLLRGGSIERLDLRRCDGLTPEGAQALRDAAPPSTKLLMDAVIMPLGSQSRPMTRSSSASHPASALPTCARGCLPTPPNLAQSRATIHHKRSAWHTPRGHMKRRT